jgi:hypothetical protein
MMLGGGAVAASDHFGVGIILGEPTGLSGKYWLTNNTAVDAALAWSFEEDDALHLHSDYLFHNLSLFNVDKGKLGVHFGIGGRLKFDDDSSIGIRIPVGLTYVFENAPVDIFLELVPLLDVIPDTRYFFGSTSAY